jgi:hypothetical protein
MYLQHRNRLAILLTVAATLVSPHAISRSIAQAARAQPSTQFGILYSLWHCLALSRTQGKPYNIDQALTGERPWGPVPEFHFWAEPQVGYYCLSDRPDILRDHAIMLRDAGIDFVVIDTTNNEFADNRSHSSPEGIVAPFKLLLDEWSKIDGAPKVVPFAPLTKFGDMFSSMMQLIDVDHPKLRFVYDGKPLGLVANDTARYETDALKYKELSARYTLRRMWGHRHITTDKTEWSFLEICAKDFLASQGRAKCRQRKTVRNGHVEQIPIAAAYQLTYISNKATAVPKFGGKTFVQQFETLFETPNVPIAIIASWNEWMAQRFCLTSAREATDKNCSLRNDHFLDGSKVFVDAYDAEYNRDIEPSKTAMRDFYYRLMKECIARYRTGELCKLSDVPLKKTP